MKLEGLISGMPNDVYHSVPDSISKSGLDLINRSPAHYFYAQKKRSYSRHAARYSIAYGDS